MGKPRDIPFKYFTARLKEIKNFIWIFPGSDTSKNISPGEINEVLLHAVTNGWAKYSYQQIWDFETNTFGVTCAMFEQNGNTRTGYKGQTPSKKRPREDDNCNSHFMKRKLG